MKILVIDDDDMVAESCKRILEGDGLTVYIADSVEKGEQMLVSDSPGPFELILTDIKMPCRDGFEMIRRVKKYRDGLPILMMTGYLTAETKEQGRRWGADHYIAKPFTPEELMGAVEETLKLKN